MSAAIALIALGCESNKPPPPVSFSGSPGASVDASALAPRASVDPSFIAAARRARAAAEALASSCTVDTEYMDEDVFFYDTCAFAPSAVTTLRESDAALRAVTPEAGAGVIFAGHLRLFAEWVEVSSSRADPYAGNGTLGHYQDLAAAWNALQPSEPVEVDVGKLDSRAQSTRPSPVARRWRRCAQRMCFFAPRDGGTR